MSARVLLATCREFSIGEPGHEALDEALLARGIDASWAVWDDIDVDWSTADLVAVRSTWDYMERVDEFLEWAERVDPVLLHGSRVFRWNVDKRYLLDLGAAGVPIVPSSVALTEADVRAALGTGAAGVVKPTVGANGVGVAAVEDGGWVAGDGRTLVGPALRREHQHRRRDLGLRHRRARGRPGGQDAGGRRVPACTRSGAGRAQASSLTDEVRSIAHQAYAATERLLDVRLTYARVDLLRHEGTLVVTEVEITEPGLYLDVMPEIAQPFADAVARLLAA